MKNFLITAALVVAFVAPAHASTTINSLFTCQGELIKDVGGYEIIQRGLNLTGY